MERIETLERGAILAALKKAGGNIGRAAKILGCARRTLQNRMREFGWAPGRAGRPKRRLPYASRRRTAAWLAGAAAVVGAAVVISSRKRVERA